MRTIRYVAWAAVAAVLAAVAFVAMRGGIVARGSLLPTAQIGGPFTLTTHDGNKLSSADLKGTPFALFFGFTFCPDVCPTTLLDLSNVLKQLGADADRMRYFFVSVDTERDTPAHLKTYLSNFDQRIMGLTGTAEEIAALAKSYRAYYEKVPTKDGFTYNHTALIYLMGRDGRFVGTIAYQENESTQLDKLRRLAASPAGNL